MNMLIDYYYRDLIYIQSLTLFNVRLRWIADCRLNTDSGHNAAIKGEQLVARPTHVVRGF